MPRMIEAMPQLYYSQWNFMRLVLTSVFEVEDFGLLLLPPIELFYNNGITVLRMTPLQEIIQRVIVHVIF